jgi:hypothetical protein
MRHESYGRRTTDVAVCVASLTDREYLNLSNAFNILPHSLLFCELGNFEFSPVYDNFFHISRTNRHTSVHVLGILSSSYAIKSFPRELILRPLIFNILLIICACRSQNIFDRPNIGIIGSNPTRHVDVCPCFFSVCVVLRR